jgi:hypothetical protein
MTYLPLNAYDRSIRRAEDREQDARYRSFGGSPPVDLDPRARTDVPVLGSTSTYDRSELMRRLQVLEYQLADARSDLRTIRTNFEGTVRQRDEAQKALTKALEATGGVVPEFQFQGNFTVCVLVDPVSERVFTGAACCNVEDTFNEEIGKAISLGRAMASRADYFAKAAYSR